MPKVHQDVGHLERGDFQPLRSSVKRKRAQGRDGFQGKTCLPAAASERKANGTGAQVPFWVQDRSCSSICLPQARANGTLGGSRSRLIPKHSSLQATPALASPSHGPAGTRAARDNLSSPDPIKIATTVLLLSEEESGCCFTLQLE